MKLNLKKQELVTLSQDAEVLANELTPAVGGGNFAPTNPDNGCTTGVDPYSVNGYEPCKKQRD